MQRLAFFTALLAAFATDRGWAEAPAAQVAHLLDGTSQAASLAGIDVELNVKLRTGKRVRVVSLDEFNRWGSYTDVARGPQIVLGDGSVVQADLLQLAGSKLVLGDASGLGRCLWNESQLDLAEVRGILWQPPAATLARDRLLQAVREYRGGEDVLRLVGGESLSGTIISAPLAGRFLPADGSPPDDVFEIARPGSDMPLAIAAAKVAAVQFASLAPPTVATTPRQLVLGFREGSLLHIVKAETSDNLLEFTLATGSKLRTSLAILDDPALTAWDAVTFVAARSPRIAFLSDLPPLGYKHIPFLSNERPFGSDRNVLGGRLRSGCTVVSKGLGMPSASRLAFDLDGSFHRFEAELAVDELAGLGGSVVFKVLLETEPGMWSPAYESPIVRGGDKPIPLRVDLKAARRLALLVDFADRGDELDYANWLNARLVK